MSIFPRPDTTKCKFQRDDRGLDMAPGPLSLIAVGPFEMHISSPHDNRIIRMV